jgi:hypothetical protein
MSSRGDVVVGTTPTTTAVPGRPLRPEVRTTRGVAGIVDVLGHRFEELKVLLPNR